MRKNEGGEMSAMEQKEENFSGASAVGSLARRGLLKALSVVRDFHIQQILILSLLWYFPLNTTHVLLKKWKMQKMERNLKMWYENKGKGCELRYGNVCITMQVQISEPSCCASGAVGNFFKWGKSRKEKKSTGLEKRWICEWATTLVCPCV